MHKVTVERISDYREYHGMLQEELAQRAMVSQQAISNAETGRGVPDVITIARIAYALGLRVSDLLTVDGVQPPLRLGNGLRWMQYASAPPEFNPAPLIQWMRGNGYKYKTAAVVLGVSKDTISIWARGLGTPRAYNLIELSRVTGANINFYFRFAPPAD